MEDETMKTRLILAFPLVLAACGYPTLEACEQASGGVCHIGLMDGKAHPGQGIDVNSPAGQAILSGVISNMNRPVTPYVLPPPVNYGAMHPTITCSTLGSAYTGTITCQ
jgi:hypothetical protein